MAENASSQTEILSALKEILDICCIYIWQIEELFSLSQFQDRSVRTSTNEPNNFNLARRQLVFDAR